METSSLFNEAGDPCSEYERLRVSTRPVAVQARQIADSLWSTFAKYSDDNFRSEFRRDFHSRFWEMYLTCLLSHRGLDIECKKPGPDILLKSNALQVWIEAIAPSPGAPASPDRVPPPVFKAVRDHPETQILLRYRAAVREKFDNKYTEYLRKGIVRPQDPYIIAVNSSKIPSAFPDWEVPAILKAVFPMGDLQITIDRRDFTFIDSSHIYRPCIPKISGSVVDTDVFLNPAYEKISAVLFSHTSAFRYPPKPGSDIILVHNPTSVNHIPQGILPFGIEYVREDQDEELAIRRIEHELS